MLTDYLLQAYWLAYFAFLAFPAIASPPYSYLTTFFLYTNFLMLLLISLYSVLLKDFEREIGAKYYALAYIAGGIAGNFGLLSVSFGLEPAIPLFGAAAGVFGVFGAYIARHPWDMVIADGLPMLSIIAFVFLTLGHIVLYGKMDFMPILVGIVLGYALPKNPVAPSPPPMGMQRRMY
ncbi:MAG: rhomboid family intramembrane serine protease [Candidatus Micrarchaeota archaeon]